jgi:dTMP kinase
VRPRTPGKLITFEGTEGAGKSTLITEVETLLNLRGLACVRTREPGGSPVAERIRELILAGTMDPWTELFLYEAARAEHLARTILPALEAGKVVLCDRFTDSSLAYQGAARGLPWKEIERLNDVATRGIRPDLTVWLDIDPREGLQSAVEITRFEREGVAFQTRVRGGFAKAARLEPARFLRLKARSGSPAEMASRVLEELEKRVFSRGTRRAPQKRPSPRPARRGRTPKPKGKKIRGR